MALSTTTRKLVLPPRRPFGDADSPRVAHLDTRARSPSTVRRLLSSAFHQMPEHARRLKRGEAAKRLDVLSRLRGLLRSRDAPDRTLRAVGGLLALELGEYCFVDVVDKNGVLQRLAIEHPDASRVVKLEVAAASMVLSPVGRAARLLGQGAGELSSRVTEAYRERALADITLLKGEAPRSYMASVVIVNDEPVAVLTLVSTHPVRRYREDERAFVDAVAEWTGLALEGPLRKEREPRATLPPPSGVAAQGKRPSVAPPRMKRA